MRTSKVVQLFFLAVVFSGHLAKAQFYAPDTDYHDMVQRVFVVEMARVLAWRENLTEEKIHEVAYTVNTNAEHQTVWQIKWLDENGKPARQMTISYPDGLLLEGPKFYRTVFQQLWDGKWKPVSSATEADELKFFWQG